MHPIIALLDFVIGLYSMAVFIYVLLQLLIHFNIVNSSQQAVASVMKFLSDITEPALSRIRKYLKPYNNFDFSALILLIGLYFLQSCLRYYF
jgi:YggT family protein